MTGATHRKPCAPVPDRGPAAAPLATTTPARPRPRPRQRLVIAAMVPGQIDITRDGQAHDRLILGGDIDEDTYPGLIAALKHLPRDYAGLHVDLSAVTFCDLAGLRAIVQLAGTATPVTLRGVPRALRTAMEILGWDQEPGLMISKH